MKALSFTQLFLAVAMLLAIAQTILQAVGAGSPLGMKVSAVLVFLGTVKHVALTLWPNGTHFMAMLRSQELQDEVKLRSVEQFAQPLMQVASIGATAAPAAPPLVIHVHATGPQPVVVSPSTSSGTGSVLDSPKVT